MQGSCNRPNQLVKIAMQKHLHFIRADADIANKFHRRRRYYSLLSLRYIVDSLVILITMSIVSAQTDIIVVDSATTLLSLLDNLISLAVDPPSLYLDLEGVKLGRYNSISIISLYVLPRKKIYLINIHRFGKTAFSIINSSVISLKTIFESLIIFKTIFDIYNDSDTLFSYYEISVNSIKDFQLIKLAT